MEETIQKTVYGCYDLIEAKTLEDILRDNHIPAEVATPEGLEKDKNSYDLIEVKVPKHFAGAARPIIEKFELAKQRLLQETADKGSKKIEPPESQTNLPYVIFGIVMPLFIAGFFLFLGISMITAIFIDKSDKDIIGAVITGIVLTILPAAAIYAMIKELKKR